MYKTTVIVPTYRRPTDLARCFTALKQQVRMPDEVLVVIRKSDASTWEFLAQFDASSLQIYPLTVEAPGVVAAMNLGLATAKGDIIAFTDDDAAPRSDWLQRIVQYFVEDSCLGAVGGRDLMYLDGTELVQGERETVGRLQWFGRVIGNHHLGYGAAREVDVLKGVNMSFRKEAIGTMCFDERMRGSGAQVHFEIAFCLALKRSGWKLLYDPSLTVDHYQARRFDEDQRNSFNALAFGNAIHNETLALLEHLPLWRRWVFVLWAFFIGNRKAFGLVQWLRFLPREKGLATQKWRVSIISRWQGWHTWRRTHSQRSAWAEAVPAHRVTDS